MKLQDKIKQRKPIEKELANLERKFGVDVALSAMRRRIALIGAIRKLQSKLEKIKTGKLPTYKW